MIVPFLKSDVFNWNDYIFEARKRRPSTRIAGQTEPYLSSCRNRTYGGPRPRITVRISTALRRLLVTTSIIRPGLHGRGAQLIRECARVGLVFRGLDRALLRQYQHPHDEQNMAERGDREKVSGVPSPCCLHRPRCNYQRSRFQWRS